MNIVVTGGCGYKGTVLVDMLLGLGHSVFVVDLQWFGNYLQAHENLVILQKDTRDLVAGDIPAADAMIHLAAVACDPGAMLSSKLTWEVNVLATQNMLEICKAKKIPQFIFASSGSVYGVKEEESVTEELSLVPLSDYNKSKMVGERVVLSYKDDLNVTIIRPATVCGYSPRMRCDLAINAFTISAIEGKIVVHGGEQYRPNVHVKDIASAYIWCLNNPGKSKSQIFNVGFENRSVMDLANMVKALSEERFHRKIEMEIQPVYDLRSYRVSSQKIINAGFSPSYSIKDGMESILEAHENGLLLKHEEFHDNAKWMKRCGIK